LRRDQAFLHTILRRPDVAGRRLSINTAGALWLPGDARHPPRAVEYVAMSDPEQPRPDDPGIFGNLPSSRPGARSPRRSRGDAAAGKSAKSRAEPKASGQAPPSRAGAKRPQARPRPSKPEPAERAEPAAPADEGQTGIEDLAWAGVAAAAEAATLGVRLATRALETVRRAAERP
jgi:hypothetical protein